MSKTPTEDLDDKSDSSKQLLEQIKGLLVLQLRKASVDDTAIGHVIGLKAKSVRNRYPLTKKENDETNQGSGELRPSAEKANQQQALITNPVLGQQRQEPK